MGRFHTDWTNACACLNSKSLIKGIICFISHFCAYELAIVYISFHTTLNLSRETIGQALENSEKCVCVCAGGGSFYACHSDLC